MAPVVPGEACFGSVVDPAPEGAGLSVVEGVVCATAAPVISATAVPIARMRLMIISLNMFFRAPFGVRTNDVKTEREVAD